MKHEAMECPMCKEVELKHYNTETDTSVGTFEEWECQSCGHYAVFDVAKGEAVDVQHELKLAIAKAIDVLRNDLYVSRAVNALGILEDIAEQYPLDEDRLVE